MMFLERSVVHYEPIVQSFRFICRRLSGVVYKYMSVGAPKKLYLCVLWVGVCRLVVYQYVEANAEY